MSSIVETSVIEIPQLAQSIENPRRVVWALAWPAVALHSLQVLNILLDTFFMGHLPTAALTARGSAFTILFLLFALSMALNTAATALVSRPYGGGDTEQYKKAAKQVLGFSVFGGFALIGLAMLIVPYFTNFMVPAGDLLAKDYMIRYLAYSLLGTPAFFIIESLAGSLTAVGDTKSPMFISGFQILLHIALNVLLIMPSTTWPLLGNLRTFGFGFGIEGAGMASAISFWAAAIIYMFWATRTKLGSCWALRLPHKEWVRKIVKVGGPATFTWLIRVGMYVAFNKVLSLLPEGSKAIAAMNVGFAVEAVAFLPAVGLGIAAAALIGQSLGMKNTPRAERLGWLAAHHAAIMTGLIAAFLLIFARPFAAALMPGKPDIQSIVVTYTWIVCITEPLFAYALVLMSGMQGAGDTVRPMWITILCMAIIRLPLTFLLAYTFKMGMDGCWLAMSATQAIQGFMVLAAFKQGKWKTKTL